MQWGCTVFLLCLAVGICSGYGVPRPSFGSKYYQQKYRNSHMTMEQAHGRNSYWEAAHRSSVLPPQPNCTYVLPSPGFGTQVDSGILVCNDQGKVCHHTTLARCCNGQTNKLPGGREVDVGGTAVQVEFFYSSGGFGSGNPLGVCHTVQGSSGFCDSGLFGCEPLDRCGPDDDICQQNIIVGSCNPDPNPSVGGCDCEEGYERPTCCECSPGYFRSFTSATEFTCEPICRENCASPPTTLGCSSCETGYQGPGCCECAPNFVRVDGKCEPVCITNCRHDALDTSTGECSECLKGYAPTPTCCDCAPGYVNVGGVCRPVCTRNCDGTTSNGGCARCKEGYQTAPLCCTCKPGFVQQPNGDCIFDGCEEGCPDGLYNPSSGCSQCKEGFQTAPRCCECKEGFIRQGDECVPPCPAFCQQGFYNPVTGCAPNRCLEGHTASPLCCDCLPEFEPDPVTGLCRRVVICEPPNALNPLTRECCPGGQLYNPATQQCECPSPLVFNPATRQCESNCGGNQDIIFMLDFSQTFNIMELHEVIGSLQILAQSFRRNADVRSALVLYPVTGTGSNDAGAHVIYDTSNFDCARTVSELDELAGPLARTARSETTSSFSALEYLGTENLIRPGRRTSVIAIQDGYSNSGDRISRIQEEIRNLKTDNVKFLAAGIIAEIGNRERVEEELTVLGESVSQQRIYVSADTFITSFIDLLVNNGIVCEEEAQTILGSATNGLTLRLLNYDNCLNRRRSNCAESELGVQCETALKNNLMADILSAVQQVFNDAFHSQ